MIRNSIQSAFLIAVLTFSLFGSEKLTLHFFGSATCGECQELKAETLQPILSKHSDSLEIVFHDTDKKEDMALLLLFEKNFNIQNGAVQELFFPDTALLGFDEIALSADKIISSALADKKRWTIDKYPTPQSDSVKTDDLLNKKVDSFSFGAIVALGLIDGINPCAIATMIFLISFLAVQKRSRRDILAIGLAYTAAVFVTYTLIGAAAFEFLSAAKHISVISHAVKWLAVILAGTVGIVSLVDAYRFRKSGGDLKTISLQLPDAVKKQIHKVIHGNLKQKNLILGAAGAGFLVTILETFCTGQTYLPAITAMVKSSEYRAEGWARLLFYNLLFVLPLLLVMIGAFFGLTWNELARQTQKNMVLLKVILGIVMICLAVYLALG